MDEDFIIMYVQSYLHYNFNRFSWRSGDEKTHKEIKMLFDETISEYNIDTSKIIIGGFSAGGLMAIDLVASNIIPVKGFLGGCPGDPGSLDLDAAKRMKDLNQKGFIFAGETDSFRERQDKMMKLFDEAEFSYEFHEIKGLGHSIPDDFSNWIDQGLEYLLN